MGLCVPSTKTISINKQIIYILAGPLTSFLIGSIACYLTFAYDLHGFLKLFLIVFLGSAFLDILGNLLPNQTPIKLYDGTITYNDGYYLKQLFYYKRLPNEYSEAANFFNEQKFAEAAPLFEKLLSDIKDENIYRLAINSYLLDKKYEKVKELSDKFALMGKMNSQDFSHIALSYSQLGLHDEALKLYDKSLQLDPDNKYSLNNNGYTLNLMEKYEEAIVFFDRAIDIDKDFAYSHNNRGLAKIKLGQTEEGLLDINHSFKLDPNNSYGYRNLGIYHFDKKEFDEALKLFEKAKQIDDTTHMINDLINDAKLNLKEGQQATRVLLASGAGQANFN